MGYEKLIMPPDMNIMVSEKLIVPSVTVMMTPFVCHV